MRKLIFAAALTFLLGSATSYAGFITKENSVVSSLQKEKKTKVAEQELPATIQRVLKSSEYKDWKLDQAILVEGASEYYKIELKKDDQKQTLNLDKYGNKVSVMES